MDTLLAIRGRYSEPKVKTQPVPRDLIEQLLAAAVQAPNHHRVRPWRFFVLQGEARARLGEAMAAALQARKPDSEPVVLEAERAKPLRAPLIIAIGVDRPEQPKALAVENLAACAAAAQNLLLAAFDLGLGALWRSGEAAYDPRVKAFFGLEPDQDLLGFIYIGYPQEERSAGERPSFTDRTTWME